MTKQQSPADKPTEPIVIQDATLPTCARITFQPTATYISISISIYISVFIPYLVHSYILAIVILL